MKILILGMGPSKDDRPDGYDEIWGLPWSAEWKICDRMFEVHDWRLVNKIFSRPVDYVNRLRKYRGILYMRQQHADIPCSVAYPLEPIQEGVFRRFPGTDYFCSSVAYMLALAIHLRPERIGLYGVEVRGKDRFDHQRPNLEFLLGVAAGRNIELDIAEKSELLMYEPRQVYGPQQVYYPERYGELPEDWSIVEAAERVA